ncbi:cation:proton antiporter domain-containing protein [Alienimonas californiensis]|uniref:Potassium/proton antiporter n=1 Tax=Alienimonas californiensis TaxID=2527989 RepID=A0A517P4K3_9PLAN|nr:cation:proton antiporter [Alienimonas californiensis]QDT14322.1 potassium/proton antiporter [Alienimonas californiensis]
MFAPAPTPPELPAPDSLAPFDLDLPLLLGGAVVMAIAAFHGRITRTPGTSGPLLALLAGVAVGPIGLGWFDPADWGEPAEGMRPAALLTLAIGLTGVALRLPRRCVLSGPHLRTLGTLLGPVMLAMWGASAFCAWAVLGLDGWAAALVGAAVVPTDPVLASAVVSGDFARKHLPGRLRHAISAESGANDGLAVPLVALAAAGLAGSLAAGSEVNWAGWGDWFVEAVLREAVGAALVGAACGGAAAALLRWSERSHDTDETGLLAFALALTLAVLGAAGLLGVSGPLAVFFAGLTLAWQERNDDRREEGEIQDAVNQFFLLPVFGLLGAALPWGDWAAFGWRGPAFAAALLLVRRPPWVWLLGRFVPAALPDLRENRDRLFAGWFGPIGVAALYYAAEYHADLPALWPAVTLAVTGSVLAHGATAAPLTRRYDAGHRDGPVATTAEED